MKRREMIKRALSASAAAACPQFLFAGKENQSVKPAREFDVIVCGGGPAGWAAAVASARKEANTALIEQQGCLGGIWTSGLVCLILDWRNKGGLLRELLAALDKTGAQDAPHLYDPEAMKFALDSFCAAAGVKVRLYTRVCAVNAQGGKIESVETESVSGREIWRAKAFVDATGNGDVGAYAGAGFSVGNKGGKCQPATLFAIVSGLETAQLKAAGLIDSPRWRENFKAQIAAAGMSPSYSSPSLFQIRDGWTVFMVNHEFAVPCDDAEMYTAHTVAARAEINKMAAALRALGGVWKNMRLALTASHLGIREGRRLRGKYEITAEDVARGARFEDAVCRVEYWTDIHGLDASSSAFSDGGMKSKPYDIPMRALESADFSNLYMAGRCISGGFISHASYRVTGNAAAMGEAVGKKAAARSLG